MATFRQRALNEQNSLVYIGQAEFDIYTPEETRNLSVKEIITPLTFDPLGHPIVGGLYDSALGPMNDKGNPCSTCQGRYSECDGHFGHIELHLPLVNPIFHDFIGSILKLTCLKCFSIQIPDVLKVYLPLQMRLVDCGMITEAEELGQITDDLAESDISINNIKPEILKVISDFKELCRVLEGNPNHDSCSIVKMRNQLRNKILKFKAKESKHKYKLCITCKEVCYFGLKYQKKRVSLAHQSKIQEKSKRLVWNYVNPDESRKYLREIWKREPEFLMVMAPFLKQHKERQYPTDLFYLDVVCVSPPNKRPANMLRGKLVENPKTNTYRELLKNNVILKYVIHAIKYGSEGLDGLAPDAKEVYNIIRGKTSLEKLNLTWENMQKNVDYMLDAADSKEFVGLKQTIEKKEGLFRMHMQGKRVNFSARSVITPDPLLDIDEIGVPESFALKLTYPTYVNPHNIEELRQMVLNGPLVHPGANSVEFKNCQIVRLDPKNRLQRESIAKRLMTPEEVRNGDYSEQKIVHRHLCNGDIVLMNRQPSLHKSSIMAHKVKILKGPKTLRLHYANCKSYNADFDGDEMNLHFPQTEKARSEAYNLVNVSNQYLVSKDGTPLTGLIQDHVLSAVSLSIRGRFFSESKFQNLVFQGLLKKTGKIKLPEPAVLRPYKMWSGKQVISTIIVNVLPNGKKLMFLKSKSKIDSKDWQNGPNRMFVPDELLSESTVMIRNGELLSGVLDKAHLGATPYGLIHCVYQLYGPNYATELLSAFSRLFTCFLQIVGFTLGVQDIVTQSAADERRKKIERQIAKVGPSIMKKALNVSNDMSDEDLAKILLKQLEQNPKLTAIIDREYKTKLGVLTNKMNNACMPGLVSKFPENNLQLMVISGAKGTKVNTMQISCCLGQIELEGKRPPRMINGKTLPSFPISDFSPKAGGYVSRRFMVGIVPQEFFFHCMAGREGLIDTAVKTSRSGYLQRCLVKNLEGLRVRQDMTVRDSDGTVIQIFYGGDGMDVGKSQFLDEKHFPFLKDNIDAVLDKAFVKSMSENERVKEVKEYIDKLKQWKEENGTALSKKRYNAFTLFTAFHLSKYGTKTTKEELLQIWNEADDDFKQNFIQECQPCPDPVISRYLPQSSFGSISEKLQNSIDKFQCSTKKEKKAFGNLIKQIGMSALCDSGEPVGLLAAQSIGEPSTQMTLNTFHFAGRGDMNVTLGIPRLQEILMTASKNIKTPSMVIPFLPIENLEYESDALRKKFNKVTVRDVLKNVSVTTECPSPDINQYTLYFTFIEHEHYQKDYCVTPKHIMKHMRKKYLKLLFKSLASLQEKDSYKGDNKTSKLKEEEDDDNEEDTSEKEPIQESDSSDDEPEDNEDAKKTRRYNELHEDGEGSDEDEKSDNEEDEVLKLATDIDEDDAELIEAETKKECLTYDKKTHLWCRIVFSVQLKNTFDPNFLVKDTVEKSVIWEVPAINKAITYTKDNVKYLRTDGINIEEVQRYDQILDLNKIYCNDIHMMIEHFGVEAGVNAIMKEIKEVFGLYEIKIDNRHLTLISDFMTKLGSFEALNRKGMESSVSPFQQMSFEASVTSLKRAVLDGKTDKLKNISASLTCCKSSAFETGDFNLMQKFYIPK